VLDRDGIYAKLWNANAAWLTTILPNVEPILPNEFRRVAPASRAQRVAEAVASFFPERLARRLQEWWFPEVIRRENNRGVGVITSATMLKLHVNDPRATQRTQLVTRLHDTL
jgi:hypothetical protein